MIEVHYHTFHKEKLQTGVKETLLPSLYGAIVECFLHRLETFGISNPHYPFEEEISKFCEEVGVDPSNRVEVVSFFRHFLKREGNDE